MTWTQPSKSTSSYTGANKNTSTATLASEHAASYSTTSKSSSSSSNANETARPNLWAITSYPWLLALPWQQVGNLPNWTNNTKS